MISPYIIRLATHQEEVGTLSGTVYAASTVGSIAGVFITAYVLLDHYSSTTLFLATGWLISALQVYVLPWIFYGRNLPKTNRTQRVVLLLALVECSGAGAFAYELGVQPDHGGGRRRLSAAAV